MINVEEMIAEMNAEDVARALAAAISRVGAIGLEAGEAFAVIAEAKAGDPDFEEGLAQINA